MSLRRTLAGLMAAGCAIASFALTWQTPALANTTVLCPVGYETATYDPGLTTTTQTVDLVADGATGPCTGDSSHTAGLLHFTGSGSLSCVSGSSSGSGSIDWTNSDTSPSVFTFTAGVGLRPGGVSVLVLEGTVTSGDFAGQAIEVVIILVPSPTQALQCLTTTGVETSSGAVSIVLS